jgi:hypothetical protein
MKLLSSLAALALVASAACGGSAPTPSDVAPKNTSAPSITTSFADPMSETFDGIAVGMGAAALEKLLGAPDEKGTPVEMGATGMFEADWRWSSRGLRLRMGARSAEEAPTVSAIEIAAPSSLRTSRGVGLGATRAEVEAAYKDALGKGRDPNEPDPDTEQLLVLGSVYGGTFFRFEGGKLVSVFVGAGAE